jgi:hypothetical protein
MPNYYNPYNFYPATYQSPVGYQQQPISYGGVPMPIQQSGTAPVQQGPKMMEWVEGEVGAKAFQMPNGWPANSPIPLWDSTDTVIYLKSWGPMGIPNPIQKLRYEMPEQQNQALLSGNSGNSQPDMSQYVTKQDLEEIRKEMVNLLGGRNEARQPPVNNQNGSNSAQNRGVNRNG